MKSSIVSSATFGFFPFLPSFQDEVLLLTGMGTNDAELAVDDTEVIETIITRCISPAAGGRGETGAVNEVEEPASVDGPAY